MIFKDFFDRFPEFSTCSVRNPDTGVIENDWVITIQRMYNRVFILSDTIEVVYVVPHKVAYGPIDKDTCCTCLRVPIEDFLNLNNLSE